MFEIRLFCAVLAVLMAGVGTGYGQSSSTRRAVTPGSATSPFASFAVINDAAVDGSTLSLRVFEGGLSRVVIAPGGLPKKTNFRIDIHNYVTFRIFSPTQN